MNDTGKPVRMFVYVLSIQVASIGLSWFLSIFPLSYFGLLMFTGLLRLKNGIKVPELAFQIFAWFTFWLLLLPWSFVVMRPNRRRWILACVTSGIIFVVMAGCFVVITHLRFE